MVSLTSNPTKAFDVEPFGRSAFHNQWFGTWCVGVRLCRGDVSMSSMWHPPRACEWDDWEDWSLCSRCACAPLLRNHP
eukprot:4872819-Amphidinium_carterae.1